MLSVIIPVYNTEKYIRECVESVLLQNCDNLEIVLVDDGSSDGSPAICDEISMEYDNVSAIHIANSGPYTARKIGVSKARGDVITFVDSDDKLLPDAYAELLEIYRKNLPDIISFDYVTSEGKLSEKDFENGLYDKERIVNEIIPNMMYRSDTRERGLNPSVCCKFFKKSVYESVVSEESMRIDLGEDALISYPAICIAHSLYIIHKSYYWYRIIETSATHLFPFSRMDELLSFHRVMRDKISESGYSELLKVQIDNYLRIFLDNLINNRFEIRISECLYRFPYSNIENNARVCVYGAGVVGKSYVYDISQTKFVDIVGLIDKKGNGTKAYFGVPIINPNKLVEIEYDVILIAIENEIIADEVRRELIQIGVSKSKILWCKPKKII